MASYPRLWACPEVPSRSQGPESKTLEIYLVFCCIVAEPAFKLHNAVFLTLVPFPKGVEPHPVAATTPCHKEYCQSVADVPLRLRVT